MACQCFIWFAHCCLIRLPRHSATGFGSSSSECLAIWSAIGGFTCSCEPHWIAVFKGSWGFSISIPKLSETLAEQYHWSYIHQKRELFAILQGTSAQTEPTPRWIQSESWFMLVQHGTTMYNMLTEVLPNQDKAAICPNGLKCNTVHCLTLIHIQL